MKKYNKQILSLALAGSIAMAGSMTAAASTDLVTPGFQYEEGKMYIQTIKEPVPVQISAPTPVPISAPAVPLHEVTISEDMFFELEGSYMIPIRHVAESIGFNVSWVPETMTAIVSDDTKEASVSVMNDSDVVSFLPNAIIIDGSMYVPSNFFEKELDTTVNFNAEDMSIHVDTIKYEVENTMTAFIQDIRVDDEKDYAFIDIMNDATGMEYSLIVNEESEIFDPITGEDLKVTDLKENDRIYVEHSPAMTRSLPPQTVAFSIERVNDTAISYGFVEDIDMENDTILFNIGTRGGVHVTFMEDLIIEDAEGNELTLEELTPGKNIKVYHSQIVLTVEPLTYPTSKVVVIN
ncbi:copper amine oxidase N-terminal domain-containing protein [Vallitalea okinawensis]|uniref:copper amine oxidase N-terminal domain-containing protein n=1 Tax=Vallitalea okinawensis TaxID=2078660 RepID=UPI000CFD9D21|nr:copper amine oxidase N-terminal domain-containing protein [Vallitalea okinawensis]